MKQLRYYTDDLAAIDEPHVPVLGNARQWSAGAGGISAKADAWASAYLCSFHVPDMCGIHAIVYFCCH